MSHYCSRTGLTRPNINPLLDSSQLQIPNKKIDKRARVQYITAFNLNLYTIFTRNNFNPLKEFKNIKEDHFWQEISYEENENSGKNLHLKIYYLSISRL